MVSSLSEWIQWMDRHRVALAAALLGFWYAVSLGGFAVGGAYPTVGALVDILVNRDGRYSMPEGPVETYEDIAWLVALVGYALALFTAWKTKRPLNPGLVALTALCFVALGEETSWGQKYFEWRAPDAIRAVNFQQETNLHNLDLGDVFGAGRSGLAYRALKLLIIAMNPAFEAACLVVWLVLPTLRERGVGLRWRAVRLVPVPLPATRLLFVAGLVAYVVVDKLIVDCGELMELSLALAAALSARDLRRASAEAPSTVAVTVPATG